MVFKIIKGKPSKIEYGVPLIVEPLKIHDVDHIVNDAFRDYLCREPPGNKRQLFNSLVSLCVKFNDFLSVIGNNLLDIILLTVIYYDKIPRTFI